ncbi:MAG: HD domain-containing protein [Phycisphaerales bacterium]|jgi:guanosine-3',5'-bis(diphosphate) 3'-pyrophosphohydrolase|nr:HD domain-containing protein [Phycisphaerales bacterium]
MSHELWQRAASFAARAHQHTLRKDGKTPYFAHPVRVALTVRHAFGHEDETTLAAALLHDTIEDTSCDYDDIAEHFGEEVARLVVQMSKNMLLPEDERERDYDARLAAGDWRGRLIKLADVYDNLADGAGKREKMLDKVRRAIALAQPDLAHHPETKRAIDALEALVRKG